MNDENENQRNDSESSSENVYDELKGFFPEEYDLSPEELVGASDPDSFEVNELSPIWDDLEELPSEETDDMLADGAEKPVTDADISTEAAPEPETIQIIPEKPAPLKTEATKPVLPQAPAAEADKTKKVIADIFDMIEMVTLCVACIIIIFSFLARLTIVDGPSMDDTLHDGEFLVISDLFYTPTQGDIVVLQNTGLEAASLRKPIVKRIIATSGQTVTISENGAVKVKDTDGSEVLLTEDYTKDEMYMKRPGTFTVPDGSLFVMGDNRNNSTDSRDPNLGFVDERCIIGHAILRFFPFDRAAVFKNPY